MTKAAAKGSGATRVTSKRKREVEVVSCGAAFPVSNRPNVAPVASKKLPPATTKPANQSSNITYLDWNKTAEEVRNLGATAFVKKKKSEYADEQYERLTGRKRKKPHVPLPIVRGIRKKAAERAARASRVARESGLVLPKPARTPRRKTDSTSRVYGPAPSIGFVSKGIFRVKKNDR